MRRELTKKLILFFTVLTMMATCNNAFALDPPVLTVSTSEQDLFISWTSVSGATTYTLFYVPFPYAGPHTIGNVDMGAGTSLSAALPDGASAYLAVAARDGNSMSEISNIEIFNIELSPQPRCDGNNLDLCTDSGVCAAANLYWYDSECHEDPEPGPDTFSRLQGDANVDYMESHSGQQTADGGYIAVGYAWSNGAAESSDVYLLKIDGDGNKTWAKTFGGGDWDHAVSVRQTADEGYIISGHTKSFSAGDDYDAYLIKTDSAGNETWFKTFGGTNYETGRSVVQTADGGYIIAGQTKSSDDENGDLYLIKTDGDGNETWSKTFGGDNEDYGRSVRQTYDGGYIVAGYTSSFGAGGVDYYLVKTDGDGNETWSNTYGGVDSDYGASVDQTDDMGYIIAGYSKSSGAGSYDAYLVKTDGSGNVIWSNTYGGEKYDYCRSVRQTNDGGYIFTGKTASFGAVNSDVYLVKTDGLGNETWSKTFGGANSDYGKSVQQTLDGGFFIAGYTFTNGFPSHSEFYLIKTDSNGNL